MLRLEAGCRLARKRGINPRAFISFFAPSCSWGQKTGRRFREQSSNRRPLQHPRTLCSCLLVLGRERRETASEAGRCRRRFSFLPEARFKSGKEDLQPIQRRADGAASIVCPRFLTEPSRPNKRRGMGPTRCLLCAGGGSAKTNASVYLLLWRN